MTESPSNGSRPPRIALVVAAGFADWEYAFIAGTGGPFYGMDVEFFAPEPGKVVSQGGLSALIPNAASDILGWEPDVLAVIGGLSWDRDDAPDVSAILEAQHRRGGTVAGICGGTLALARAGLLDAVRHTSNDLDFLVRNAPGYRGGARFVRSAKAITDGRIVTAPGTAAAGFAAAVFRAAGMTAEIADGFLAMTAAEHA